MAEDAISIGVVATYPVEQVADELLVRQVIPVPPPRAQSMFDIVAVTEVMPFACFLEWESSRIIQVVLWE